MVAHLAHGYLVLARSSPRILAMVILRVLVYRLSRIVLQHILCVAEYRRAPIERQGKSWVEGMGKK